MELENPWIGLIALVAAAWSMHRVVSHQLAPAVAFSRIRLFAGARRYGSPGNRRRLLVLDAVILGLLALALARPRTSERVEEILTPGVDIAVALDISGSMLAEDTENVSRLAGAKKVLQEFVDGREPDRIALIVFAAQAFTQCPLTLDHELLKDLAGKLQIGLIKEDGTAIGMGIATALNRLKESDAKSRVVILVTDGRNNSGRIEPLTAAEMARSLGVKVYTIGVGGHGPARIPVRDPLTGYHVYRPFHEDLNEEVLQQIARDTGAQYYRATDPESLGRIFREISSLEKTEIKSREYFLYTELFMYPLGLAILLLAAEFVLRRTAWRQIP